MSIQKDVLSNDDKCLKRLSNSTSVREMQINVTKRCISKAGKKWERPIPVITGEEAGKELFVGEDKNSFSILGHIYSN